MSHRVYLYNVNQPGKASEVDKMMMEWSYELPIFMQPLLIDGGNVGGNNYNTHTPGENSGLFYNAQAGIENLKRFYNFIEEHQDELIDNIEGFKNAKENIFKYLDNLEQPFFNVDAWDVFNMNSESHQEQAEQWLEDIRCNNAVINNAIDADNIFLLKLSLFTIEVGEFHDDFRSLFNYSNYGYGWEVIDQPVTALTEVEIFEENKLWGLKDEAGKILIAPKYDEFYNFNNDDIAVVFVGGQYGYVNKTGTEIIKPQFDDAFDFVGEYATVVKGEKSGQIDKRGEIVIHFIYQYINGIKYEDGYFTAKLNDKWGVVDANNKILIPLEYDEPVEAGDYGETYTIAIKGRKTKLIFTKQFAFITECENHYVRGIPVPNERYIYEVVKNKKSDKNLLFDHLGRLLLSGYEKIINSLFHVFVIRKDKKYGVIDHKGTPVIHFENDRIDELDVLLPDDDRDLCAQLAGEKDDIHCVFLKVKQGPKCRVHLIVNDFSKQISDFIYDDIVSLRCNYFAVKNNDLWGVIHILGELKVPIEYDLILSGEDTYCLKGNLVYSFDSDGINEADKTVLQDYIDAKKKLGSYYFDDDVANRLQAYVDRDLPEDEVYYQKAWTLLHSDKETNLAEAINNYQQAINLGLAKAMNELALIYEDAQGKNPQYKDEEQSFQLFLKSAQGGSKVAMLNVGICYADGMGTPVNRKEMLNWYNQAYLAGNMSAAIMLGHYYYQPVDGNYELALKYYLKAEENGELVELELGWLYNYFDNPVKALPHLLKASLDDGVGYAIWQLGVYAEYGIEMKVNLSLAIKRYKVAADLSYGAAFKSLYEIYANHEDFMDKSLADEYAKKARAAGF